MPSGRKRTFKMLSEGTGLLLQNLRASAADTNDGASVNPGNANSSDSEVSDIAESEENRENFQTPSSGLENNEQLRTENEKSLQHSEKELSEENAPKKDAGEESDPVFVPINYDYSHPKLLVSVKKCFKLQSTSPQKKYFASNNFLKGCKWSPDGSCLLTNSEDRKMRVFSLRTEIFAQLNSSSVDELSEDSDVVVLSETQEGELVYDYCWFPRSSVQNNFLYASTSRYHPVHLRSGISGKVLGTYRAVNHLEEVASAYSLCFSLDGNKLCTGFKKAIRVFDVERAGRESQLVRTSMCQLVGQSSIISCIAMCPDSLGVYAAASYGKTIGIYTLNANEVQSMFQGHCGGITHILFSPDGKYLYSGGRKDSEILCWDMRRPGQTVCAFQRQVDTNQRVLFDLDRDDKFLVSACSSGEVRVWDVDSVKSGTEKTVEPVKVIRAHRSAVNGISLNPSVAVMASASGQRIFPCPLMSESEEEKSDLDDYERNSYRNGLDNSLKLWYIGT